MNKKSAVMLSVTTLLLGAIGAISYQVHAQSTSATAQPVAQVQSSITSTSTDTDNIQDENGGPEKADTPDSAIQNDGDKETHDDTTSTSSVENKDVHEQEGINDQSNKNETEDAQ
jgi:hypothetical protein